MRTHFRNRKYHFWTHPHRLSVEDRLLAAETVRCDSVQRAIDQLEALLPPEDRLAVAVLILILDKPVPRDVVIELQGPTELLTVIRDQLAPHLVIAPPYLHHTEAPSLHVPMEMVTHLAREAASTSPVGAKNRAVEWSKAG